MGDIGVVDGYGVGEKDRGLGWVIFYEGFS